VLPQLVRLLALPQLVRLLALPQLVRLLALPLVLPPPLVLLLPLVLPSIFATTVKFSVCLFYPTCQY
jgi:hypothetical protein